MRVSLLLLNNGQIKTRQKLYIQFFLQLQRHFYGHFLTIFFTDNLRCKDKNSQEKSSSLFICSLKIRINNLIFQNQSIAYQALKSKEGNSSFWSGHAKQSHSFWERPYLTSNFRVGWGSKQAPKYRTLQGKNRQTWQIG